MNNKKGFISTTIIYSFFLVFILFMIAILMSYVNKNFLKDKLLKNIKNKQDISNPLECKSDDLLSDCLFKSERRNVIELYNKAIEYKNENNFSDIIAAVDDALDTGYFTKDEFYVLNYNFLLVNDTFNSSVDDIKKNIKTRLSDNTTSLTNKDFESGYDFYPIPGDSAEYEYGMYSAEDDYGTSYYYLGAEKDNYVLFADKLWSIIRVNGDNTIRLIYQGEWDKIVPSDDTDAETRIKNIKNYSYIDINDNNQYDFKDARHFNSNMLSSYKKKTYEYALKFHNFGKETICNDNESKAAAIEYINNLFCTWNQGEINKELEKILNYGNGVDKSLGTYKYKGASSLWNAGFMNNGAIEVDKVEKLSNASQSDALTFLTGWFEHELKGYKNYISKSTDICGVKDFIVLTTKKTFFETTDFISGTYCTKTNSAKLFPQNSPLIVAKICEKNNTNNCYYKNGTINFDIDKEQLITSSWDFSTAIGESGCKTNGYSSGYEVASFTFTAWSLLNNTPGNLKCVADGYDVDYSLISVPETIDYSYSLVSARELAFAGLAPNKKNENSYLSTNFSYWTSDLAFANQTGVGEEDMYYFVLDKGNLTVLDDVEGQNVAYIKPVINLIGDIKYKSGMGTIMDPYIIGL